MVNAAEAALRSGFGGAELDTAGTLALAVAGGAAPEHAAWLIACYAQGMAAGQAERREQKEQVPPSSSA